MRKPLVAGNWKMNGTLAEIGLLVAGIKEGLALGLAPKPEVLLCPPYVYLPYVADSIVATSIRLGAQDLSQEGQGAFTGEVSGDMLKELGCGYVIVGHSERRGFYGETDEWVAQKFLQAQKTSLIPILCVGESLEQREAGETELVIDRQLKAVLDAAGVAAFDNAVVAYEPVWAIGTGKTATTQQAQAVHEFIRGLVAGRSEAMAGELRILYGGSVKADNSAALFSMPDIDGGLIGGASLDAEEFLSICRSA